MLQSLDFTGVDGAYRTRLPRGQFDVDAALDVVSGKWKGLILWELEVHGVRRFAELRRGLHGVSEKMLTQHLREMEEDGLIHRQVYAEVPPRVEFSLTESGRTLEPVLVSLARWGREHAV